MTMQQTVDKHTEEREELRAKLKPIKERILRLTHAISSGNQGIREQKKDKK